MKKNLTPKQQATLAKKEKIYEVAIALFREYGYENTSIREICANANVTTGSLYNLYENKAAILYNFKDKLTEKANIILMEANVDAYHPLDTITNYLLSILLAFHELGVEMTLQLHNQHKKIWNQKTEGTLLLENYILLCQKHHTMRDDMSKEEIADAINTIAFGLIYQWCEGNGDYDLIEKASRRLPIFLSPFINLQDEA